MAVTPDEVYNDVMNYADFEEVGSVARARKFVTAAKRYLLSPSSSSGEGKSMQFDTKTISELLARAEEYVVANATDAGGAKVKYITPATDFRG